MLQSSKVNVSVQESVNFAEPSYMVEFKEHCNSHYEMIPKEDSDEISSEGEFQDARRMVVYQENAVEVLQIENQTRSQSEVEEALNSKEGLRSRRNKGLKHFNKVGYAGSDNKEIPRWASDDEMVKKVLARQ